MPEYLAPGVYVEEISTGAKPIEGVSTSVAGFLGLTERGPEDIHYITSWIEYQPWYGGHLGTHKSFMSYAVQGFFDNGGQRCYIGRVVDLSEAKRAELVIDGKLRLSAIGRGGWGSRVFVRVRPASQKTNGVVRAADWVRITIYYYANQLSSPPLDPEDSENTLKPELVRPTTIEDFDNLSFVTTATNFAVTAINLGSKLVRAVREASGDTIADLGITGLTGVNDADPLVLELNDYQGNLEPLKASLDPDKESLFGKGCGLEAMDTIDEVSLLLAPDHVRFNGDSSDDDLADELIKRCELLKDRFAVLSTKLVFPTDSKPVQDSSYGAQYYPWIRIYDPFTRDDALIPPSGHVAGIIARTDLEQGVHKAPANAVVIGAKGLQLPVTKGNQAKFNPVGINCVRDFRSDGRGIRLWGARTMSSDPEWKYVNVRRLFLFIEESIDEGTQWVVFEPNAPTTWARVQQSIANFLTTIWRNGALVGATRDEAFFVKCDKTTMTQDDIDGGRMICYIGVAPVKPAEFVIFRIGQKTADAQA